MKNIFKIYLISWTLIIWAAHAFSLEARADTGTSVCINHTFRDRMTWRAFFISHPDDSILFNPISIFDVVSDSFLLPNTGKTLRPESYNNCTLVDINLVKTNEFAYRACFIVLEKSLETGYYGRAAPTEQCG